MSLFITLKLIAPLYLFYTFDSAILHLQLWRPVTAFFYMGKFDFSFIFSIYFAYIALNKV
jgi:Derlin-2/3